MKISLQNIIAKYHCKILLLFSLLSLPILCKAAVKKDVSGSCTFEDRKTLLDTIPKKPNYFLKKNINSDFPKIEYSHLTETGFLPREEVSNTLDNSDKSEGKKYERYRRMKEEEVNVVDIFTNDTITLGKGRAYYFYNSTHDSTRFYIEDRLYTKNDAIYKYKVSKDDWDNAFSKSDECSKDFQKYYKSYIVHIHFKDGKAIEYDTQNNNHSNDWTKFHEHQGYEYYYVHCLFNITKEDATYDVLEDESSVWSYFKDTRRDYKEVVKMITDTGHYAKYQDTVGSGYCGWSANIQLKHDEIDFIEIR